MSVVCLALAGQETALKYSTYAGHITDARCRCHSSLGVQTYLAFYRLAFMPHTNGRACWRVAIESQLITRALSADPTDQLDKYMNAGPGRLWNPNNQASPHGLSWRNCIGRRKSHTFAKHHQHETELQRPEDSLAF
jgi:hypothetical protein